MEYLGFGSLVADKTPVIEPFLIVAWAVGEIPVIRAFPVVRPFAVTPVRIGHAFIEEPVSDY